MKNAKTFNKTITQIRNDGVQEEIRNPFFIKSFLLIIYITVFLLFFLSKVDKPVYVVLILINTSLNLWFGPLGIIGNSKSRKLYDPATIFNLALFYYTVKGISLGWGEKTVILERFSQANITDGFVTVSVYLFIATLVWNIVYSRAIKRSDKNQMMSSSIIRTRFSNIGALGLIVIGVFSFFMFFRVIDQDILIFLLRPHSRAYLGNSGLGIGSPFAYFFLEGIYLLSTATILLLANTPKGKRPPLLWWIFVLLNIIIYILISPRAVLLGYIISLIVAYHLFIAPISIWNLSILGIGGVFYSYVTNLWRSIVGGMSNVNMVVAQDILRNEIAPTRLLTFLGGTDLSDIRIFILIEQFYGKVLDFKFGSTLLRLFTQLVPRAFWPNKPYDLGVEIGQLYLPGTVSGTPPGFFAEMFMNFHVIGVVLGSGLLALALAKVFKSWVLNRRNDSTIIFYSLLAARIFLIPSSTIANILLTIIIGLTSAWFAYRISIAKFRNY